MAPKSSLPLLVVLVGIALTAPSRGAEDNPDLYLVPHNKARADVGVPPLVWSPELAAYAFSTASKHKESCLPKHSMGPYNENLAGGRDPAMTGRDATNVWVGKKDFYDRKTRICTVNEEECGHYTVIIDPYIRRIGCAKINCANNNGFIFQCDYSA